MSTNRFIRGVAAILRQTADLRAHYWRYEVSGAGWAPLPQLAVPCSCCNRRTLQPVAPWASQVEAAVRFCPDCDRLGALMVMAP
jgi:hypothetical protein